MPVVVVLVAMAAVVLFLVIVCVMKRSRQKLTDSKYIEMLGAFELVLLKPSRHSCNGFKLLPTDT